MIAKTVSTTMMLASLLFSDGVISIDRRENLR